MCVDGGSVKLAGVLLLCLGGLSLSDPDPATAILSYHGLVYLRLLDYVPVRPNVQGHSLRPSCCAI